MAVRNTRFNPVTHGFSFVNRFEFPYLFNVTLPFLGPRSIGDVILGLCGGMCAAALDYHYADLPVPEENDVEKIPLDLFRYLWSRQIDTLNFSTLERLLTWAILDTRILARLTANREIPAMLAKLDEGEPVILVLIRSRGFLSLTQNHQVLATGYTYSEETKDMTIRIYDPNHPSKRPKITLNLKYPHLGLKLAQSTGEDLRAFFTVDYQQQTPP